MSSEHTVDDVLDELAESFVERLRSGEHPSLTEYIDGHPALADEIRTLFPMLQKVEFANSSWQPPPLHRHDVPDEIGDYRILRVAGHGGMGIVYEAEQKSLGRRVALKVLPTLPHVDSRRIERFLREAKALARLDHPHILPIHEVGEADGCYYFVMPFIDGRTLDRVLHDDSEPLSSSSSGIQSEFKMIARFGFHAAEALSHAHEHGVLHRDVKPSNLIIDSSDKVWVADFGLAKDDGEGELTRTGDLVGTLRFMAPERFRGWCDPRSDVYSLGLTLYESITQQPAFPAVDRAVLIKQITQEPPPRPSRVRPGVPPELETVILKAINAEPSQRYQSAREFADELRRFLEGRPVRARHASVSQRLISWRRRNPVTAALSSVVVLLLLVGVVASSMAALHFNRLAEDRSIALTQKASSLRDAQRATRNARRLLEELQHANRKAAEQLYEANVAKADALRWSRRVGQRIGSLEGLQQAADLVGELEKPPSEVVRLRTAAINSMRLVDVQIERSWDDVVPLRFDPQRRRYIRVDDSNDVLVVDTASDQLLGRLPGRDSAPSWQEFSPDGRYIALGFRDHWWQIWQLDTQRLVREMQILGGYEDDSRFGFALDPFDFAPDGKSFAILTPAGKIQCFSLASAEPMNEIETGAQPRKLRFSPDGNKVALFVLEDNVPTIRVYDLTTRKLSTQFSVHPYGWLAGYAWSPDTRRIACGIQADKSGEISIWDAATGRRLQTLRGHLNSVRTLSFTPEGQWLVSASWDGTTRIWDLNLGEEALRVPASSDDMSGDGSSFAIRHSRSRVSMARLVVSRELQTYRARVGLASDDGRTLAVLTPKSVRLIDAATLHGRLEIAAENPVQCRYHSRTSSLVVEDSSGIWCYTIPPDAVDSHVVSHEQVRLWDVSRNVARDWFAMNRDGHLYAVADGRDVHILDRQSGDLIHTLGHTGASYVSFHPDGHLVATGAYLCPDICVWDCRTGQLVTKLWSESVKLKGVVKFSPDGRWLVAHSDDEYRFWDTDSWSLSHVIPNPDGAAREGRVAFSPVDRLIALSTQINHVSLYNLDDFSRIASMEHSEIRDIQHICFSLDGNYLLTQSRKVTDRWDLRKVREQLSSMNLDWHVNPSL